MMGRLSDRLKEYIALIKLMQPLGKLRLEILGGYSFILVMIIGMLAGCITISFVLITAAVILFIIVLIVFHVISDVIK